MLLVVVLIFKVHGVPDEQLLFRHAKCSRLSNESEEIKWVTSPKPIIDWATEVNGEPIEINI